MDKLDLQSPDIVNQNLENLAALFPNCLTETAEGKAIDFDLLKQELSHQVVEGTKERYRLEWPGKREAIVTANLPTTKTLRPVREDSVDFDNTENLYIEGDNLEVLKLLQESYLGKIKMIYIDPPYNTGNDFVYRDNFAKDTQTELEESGQKDEYNQRLVANPETSGRYHSDWLSMMYPRLKLARNLLTDDGVIFISIDDKELQNLKKICDEIFGDSQFVGTFPWRSRTAKADVPFGVSIDVEWIISYGKKDFIAGRGGERKYYKSEDLQDRWRLSDLTTNKSKEERPNSYFTMINPRNGESFESNPLRTWAVTNDTFSTYYEKKKIVFPGDYDFLNIKKPAYRVFEKEDKLKALNKYGTEDIRMSISTYLEEKEIGRTEHGSKEIRELFESQVFQYPKPTSLMSFFIKNGTNENSIILDFFSGSASTADAIIQLNSKKLTKRKFIMVQIPEPLDPLVNEQKAAFNFCQSNNLKPSITEIGKERIRRATKKIKEELKSDIDKKKVELHRLETGQQSIEIEEKKIALQQEIHDLHKKLQNTDFGFRVYMLAESNMQDVYYRPQDFTKDLLELTVDNIKPGRTPDDLMAQIMLDWGLPLSLKISSKDVQGKQVFSVADDSLYACFDNGIDEAFIKEIVKDKPLRIVFKDSGFTDDTAKVNVKQLLKQLSPETEMKVI